VSLAEEILTIPNVKIKADKKMLHNFILIPLLRLLKTNSF